MVLSYRNGSVISDIKLNKLQGLSVLIFQLFQVGAALRISAGRNHSECNTLVSTGQEVPQT